MTRIGNIDIIERESPVRLISLVETDRIFLNPALADDWRIRRDIRHRLEKAALSLPEGTCFMVYEAYRSRARQQALWTPVYEATKTKHPHWSDAALYQETARWVSPPDGFGSGHQAGAALDITLCNLERTPFDMGTKMQEMCTLTPTDAPVPADIRARRALLTTTLGRHGLINYPDEWWHFSYGDRLWAEVTGQTAAFFSPLE